MDDVILENDHGVRITEESKWCGHYIAENAQCSCGFRLLVAAPIFHADHKPGDPVMVCDDHGACAYRFSELVPGRQADNET